MNRSTILVPERIRNTTYLYVAESPDKGRGIFTDNRILKGGLIEAFPVLLFDDEKDARHIDANPLANYYYRWKEGINALALGYGSLYNHSYHPNAYYRRTYENQTLEIIALRDIAPGEEILINYNGDPSCKDSLWFPFSE